MRKNRLIGAGAAVALLITSVSVPVTATAAVSDIAGHWAQTEIAALESAGQIKGYEDGTFRPGRNVSRAEFMTMVNNVAGFTGTSDKISAYTDVPSDAWYYGAVSTALAAGYINGTSATTMNPTGNISRQEAFAIVSRAAKIDNGTASDLTAFTDASSVASWAVPEIAGLIKSGKVQGKTATTIDPLGNLTRAEAATVLYRNRDEFKGGTPATPEPTDEPQDEEPFEVPDGKYVLMNIPYADFFAAEIENDVAVTDVDVTTAATSKVDGARKTLRGWTPDMKVNTGTAEAPIYNYGPAAGSYRIKANEGTKIDGITYPVLVDDSIDLSGYTEIKDSDKVEITTTKGRGEKMDPYTMEGKDALFVADDYAYYTLTEKPSFYKEAKYDAATKKLSFGKAMAKTVKDEKAKVETTVDHLNEDSHGEYFGDYMIQISEAETADLATRAVYGIVVEGTTADNKTESYGLLPFKNYFSKGGWQLGIPFAITQTNHHGDMVTVNPEHFKNLQGGTINKITFYTSEGISYIETEQKMAYAFDAVFSVADAAIDANETTLTWSKALPDDFKASYKAEGLSDLKVADDGKVTYTTPKDATPGTTYTITASDANGKYTYKEDEFMLTTDKVPATIALDGSSYKVVAAEGFTQADVAAYISKVTSVTFGEGTDAVVVNLAGRTPVKDFLLPDGTIDLSKASGLKSGTYKVTVVASGYPEITRNNVPVVVTAQ